MGRAKGAGQGHKLSDYIKLNEKPKKKRTYKTNQHPWARDIGKTDRETRYDW